LESTEQNLSIPTCDKKSLIATLEKYIGDCETCKNVYFVPELGQFSAELIKLEEKHSQKVKTLKIGVVFCKKDQKRSKEMFLNKIEE